MNNIIDTDRQKFKKALEAYVKSGLMPVRAIRIDGIWIFS